MVLVDILREKISLLTECNRPTTGSRYTKGMQLQLARWVCTYSTTPQTWRFKTDKSYFTTTGFPTS